MEYCKICGCELISGGKDYAKPNIKGRSHRTKHHFVAKRFFEDKGEECKPIVLPKSWERKGLGLLCFECHEELLHNPVLLSEDIEKFAELVRIKGLNESKKTASRAKIAKRIELLHKVIEEGVKALLVAEKRK